MDFSIAIIPLAAFGRSFCGWIENALKDGKITTFEWRELGATTFRVGVMGVALAYGLDLSVMEAAGSAVLGDIIIMAVKKLATTPKTTAQ